MANEYSDRLQQVRLWGKILGTERDYYVAEGVMDAGAEDEQAEGADPRGSGVNKNVYFVCNGPLDEWKQLPDCRPEDILNARSIKMNFTGDLDRQFFTNPSFFDTERVYLRAQIARISHSTTLIPRGLFRLTEDNPRDIEENTPEEDEPMKIPTVRDMGDASMWCHYTPSILKQGRLQHAEGQPLDGEEDVEAEELQRREIAKDPWEARLKPISSDAKTRGGTPAWVVRSHNTHNSF